MKPAIIPKFLSRRSHRNAPGAAPGTLSAAADLPKPKIERFVYDETECRREPCDLAAPCDLLTPMSGKKIWVDIQGLGDTRVITEWGEALGLHPLVLEDIVHVHQRPKHEEYPDYLFTTLRALRVVETGQVDDEQISFVLTHDVIVTFQERPGDVFDPVRKRLLEGRGLIRKKGADYLFYALVDAIVDNYFPVLEVYEDHMDQLEDEVRLNPTPEASRNIHAFRRQLRRLRRNIWPLRDVFAAFSRDDIGLVDETVQIFFRDCHDHVIQVAEFVESNRERAADLGDLYRSVVSEKTNQVMNLLTVIATIFIPLTFLCGVYGMNFDTEVSPYNMPELKWRYGYPFFWGILIVIFIGMLVVFKRKGWLGNRR